MKKSYKRIARSHAPRSRFVKLSADSSNPTESLWQRGEDILAVDEKRHVIVLGDVADLKPTRAEVKE